MLRTKKFQRKIENFSCENCGKNIKGNGYTNHCPFCLWSKHIDINPGDRAETCLGLMYPLSIKTKRGEYIIIHKCKKCGFTKKNKMNENDSWEEIIKLSGK